MYTISQRNTKLRYKAIKEEYRLQMKRNNGMPLAQIHREFIYPKFYISLRTLYNIIYTPDSLLTF
ncbi:hypothetical protein [Apibacter mensalis]|uniref:hypothetical protein n=1 Tax=Apibacter mensalis TaxID=1586267 RepID=UPI0026EF3085|nr:hypothetical protein [Apibacter mensalis]